jgi:hypothetical protein
MLLSFDCSESIVSNGVFVHARCYHLVTRLSFLRYFFLEEGVIRWVLVSVISEDGPKQGQHPSPEEGRKARGTLFCRKPRTASATKTCSLAKTQRTPRKKRGPKVGKVKSAGLCDLGILARGRILRHALARSTVRPRAQPGLPRAETRRRRGEDEMKNTVSKDRNRRHGSAFRRSFLLLFPRSILFSASPREIQLLVIGPNSLSGPRP